MICFRAYVETVQDQLDQTKEEALKSLGVQYVSIIDTYNLMWIMEVMAVAMAKAMVTLFSKNAEKVTDI